MSFFSFERDVIKRDERVIAKILCPSDREFEDHFKKVGNYMWEWRRTFYINLSCDEYSDFEMGIKMVDREDFYAVPCVNYNGTQWGDGREPKGLEHDGIPWKYAWHRSGVPSGMYCQTAECAIALFDNLKNPLKSSAQICRDMSGKLSLSVCFPESEPVVYCARDQYAENGYTENIVLSGDKITFCVCIILSERKKAYDYGILFDESWRYFSRGSQLTKDAAQIWNFGIDFISNCAYFEESGFTGFCMGLSWNKKSWEQKRDYLEIGWVGQNASLAVSLLYEGVYGKKAVFLQRGLRILDCWAKYAVLPNGLFRTRFDRIRQFPDVKNHEERNDAANLFSVVDEYLEAYHFLKKNGIERSEYREIAIGVCWFMVEHQAPEGKFAKAWYNDGTVSDPDGIIGSYITQALCIGYEACGEKAMLQAAVRSFDYYYQSFEAFGYTTAGALDTYCIDKESAIPLFRSAIALHKLIGDKGYITKAEQIGDYLSSWQYQYDVVFPEGTVLKRIGYHTKGGTAVSVQHNHIDCYGLELCESLADLAGITGHEIWRERAEAIWQNSLQNISDGTLIIKGQRRPKGSQDEGILQTRWHTKKGDYFGVSEWLVVWNTAFRLKILRKQFLTRKNEKDKSEKII